MPGVAASRKGGVSANAGAAKEGTKEAVKIAEDVADKVRHCSHITSSLLSGHAPSGIGDHSLVSDVLLSPPYLHGVTPVWQSTGKRRQSGRGKCNEGQDYRESRRWS